MYITATASLFPRPFPDLSLLFIQCITLRMGLGISYMYITKLGLQKIYSIEFSHQNLPICRVQFLLKLLARLIKLKYPHTVIIVASSFKLCITSHHTENDEMGGLTN